MSLDEYRRIIDKYDLEILALLEKRMMISREVGKYKAAHKKSVLNVDREKQIINKLNAKTDLSRQFIEGVWSVIFDFSKREQ
jgi:chorismate mutase